MTPAEHHMPTRNPRIKKLTSIISLVFMAIFTVFLAFFCVFYRDGGWVPFLGHQFIFIGISVSLLGIWVAGAFFLWVHFRNFFWKQQQMTWLILVVFVLNFEFIDMDGDMIPRFQWRWRAGKTDIQESSPGESRAKPQDMIGKQEMVGQFTQFQGPSRNAKMAGKPMEPNWIDHPPKVVWKRPIGEGYSGCVSDGEFLYTMAQSLADPGLESAICLDLWNGSIVWERSFSGRYESGLGGAGPRATPLISGRFGYFLGALGQLNCLNLQDGSVQWSVDFQGEFGAGVPEWGFAGSPLLYREGLIMTIGAHESNQSLGCFHIESGELMWAVGDHPISWSSPTILQLNNRDVLAFMDSKSIQLRDPENGRILTSTPWGLGAPQIPMPVAVGTNRLAISSGYSVGTSLFEIQNTSDAEDWKLVEIWHNHRLKSKFSPILTVCGTYLVGLNDGTLVTLDIGSGQRLFQGERYGHGQLLWVNDTNLIIQNEQGALILLNLMENGQWQELSRFEVLESKTWNPPTLIGNHLVLRNHRIIALVSLPTTTPDQP